MANNHFNRVPEVQLTVPADFYLTPTDTEVQKIIKDYGIKFPYLPIMRDIAHLASGGGFLDDVEIQTQIRHEAERFARKQYSKSPTSVMALQESLVNSSIITMEQVRNLLEGLNYELVPGSPLQKAANIIRLIEEQASIPHPDEINDMLKLFGKLDEDDKEMLGLGGTPIDQIISFMQEKEIIKIARSLDKISKLNVYKFTKALTDPNGKEIRIRGIKSFTELGRAVSSEFALPDRYRNYRLATLQTPVREHIVYIEKKQLLYVLVDCSGSMCTPDRVSKASGAIMNRLMAVQKGDAELYYRFFDDYPHDEYHVDNREKSVEAMKRIRKNGFNGGGTRIDKAISAAANRIREMEAEEKFHRPEILVISDGDDDIRTTSANLDGIRLHSITVSSHSPSLNRLARSTGGVGIDI